MGRYGFSQGSQAEIILPFPDMYTHCAGYGGSDGISQPQITEVFTALTAAPAAIGSRVENTMGGDCLSMDCTFHGANTITTRSMDGTLNHPIGGINIGT